MTEWERCRPWIEAALVHSGTHQLADVAALVADGEAQFWPGLGCAVVTRIEAYPRFTALNLWLAGGDLAELKRMLPDLEGFAAAMGCSRVMVIGRAGWARALGYEPGWSLACKVLPS